MESVRSKRAFGSVEGRWASANIMQAETTKAVRISSEIVLFILERLSK